MASGVEKGGNKDRNKKYNTISVIVSHVLAKQVASVGGMNVDNTRWTIYVI